MKQAAALTYTMIMLWIILKMVFFLKGDPEMGFIVGTFTNILFILIIIVFTLWFKYKKVKLQDSNILSDLKDSTRKAMVYLLFICGFMLLYYTVIDKNYLDERATIRIEMERERALENNAFEQRQKLDPTMKDLSVDEYLANFEQGLRKNYQAKIIIPGAMCLLLMLSIIYSILVSLLFRKVLLK